MLVELITPLMLATAPTTVVMPEVEYNHKTQQSEVVAQWTGVPTPYTKTPNGTRTYSGNGAPVDSDND